MNDWCALFDQAVVVNRFNGVFQIHWDAQIFVCAD